MTEISRIAELTLSLRKLNKLLKKINMTQKQIKV